MCGRGTFVLLPEADAIQEYEQNHGLGGSLESSRGAADAVVMTVRGGQGRMKVVATARDMVRIRRRGRMRAGVRPRRRRGERRWAAASRRGSGARRSGAETPSAIRRAILRLLDLGKNRSGLDLASGRSACGWRLHTKSQRRAVLDLNGPPASPCWRESPGIYARGPVCYFGAHTPWTVPCISDLNIYL